MTIERNFPFNSHCIKKEVLFLKRITSIFLLTITVFVLSFQTLAVSNYNLEEVAKAAEKYLYETVTEPYPGSIGGEWCVLALSKSDLEVEEAYFSKYYDNLKKLVNDKRGVLHEKKYTEYSRTVIALNAIGKNPENICGYNLLEPLGDFEKTVFQGINGAIWTLIALDCGNYEIPTNTNAVTQATKEMYIDYILENQNADGGWALSGNASDTDVTAMALIALSKYQNTKNISGKIKSAVDFITENIKKGFSTSETISQIILAYCELKIPVESSLLDEYFEFCLTDGGFKHLKNDTEPNLMATEQATCALVSLTNLKNSKKTLYEKIENNSIFEEKDEFSSRHPDIKKQEVIYISKTYDDIQNHENKNAIENLSRFGIINGKSENIFDPNENVTRAEFSTLISKALGLTKYEENTFADVTDNDWFLNGVSTAYYYGIVKGVTENTFNPNGNITKEEACVMLARTAELCGIDAEISELQTRDILCVFSDYIQISDWAFTSVGFCVNEKILSEDGFTLNSKEAVKRGEVAQMIYNLLNFANLI